MTAGFVRVLLQILGVVWYQALLLATLLSRDRPMNQANPFKWRHFEGEIILLCVCWYLRYALSYRDLEEITTVYRWVQHDAPELDKRCRPHLTATTDSYRVDETYIKIKGHWKYLYRAVASEGNTLDFMLSAKRDAKAAKRFFRTVLKASHTTLPRVITVDKNAAYPNAFDDLQREWLLADTGSLRQKKYLNNIIEQDHRSVKRRIRPMLGFQSFHTAGRTRRGIEVMQMIGKDQGGGVC